MSYPDPIYLGDDGEASATLRPAGHEPELVYGNGTRAFFLMTGDRSHGLFGLYRWDMSEAISGPGPHFHRSIQESFYVLTGTIRIYDGRRWIDTAAGDFVHVPEGGVHAFRNESGARSLFRGHCGNLKWPEDDRRGDRRLLPAARHFLGRREALGEREGDRPVGLVDDEWQLE